MAIDAGSIYSEVRIEVDKLKKDIVAVETRLDKFGKKNSQQSEKIKKKWTKDFKEINLAGVAAFAAIGFAVKGAIDIFAKYEQEMANVRSVTAASAEDFARLEEAAIRAGETTRFTASQSAEALYFLASAGLDATESISALDGVLKLAGATGSDLAFTSATMAATLSQFSLESEEAIRVSNVFAAAISGSQATMEKLQSSLKAVGPISGALGISLEETTASLEALFNAGFAGEQAGTGLRNILLDLGNKSGPVAQKLKALGIAFEDINPKKVGLTAAIDTLAKSGVDLGQIFGKRVAAQMLVLAKTGGDALREFEEEITNTNSAAEMYAIQNDTLAGSIDFLKSAIESASIKLIKELGPALRGVTDFLTMAVHGFNALPGPIKLAIGVFAVGVPVIVGFNVALTALAGIVGTIAGPITIVVGAVAALTGAIVAVVGAVDDYNNRFKIAAEKVRDQRAEVDELIERYEELKDKSKDNVAAQEELEAVIKRLTLLVPDAVTEFDKYNKAIGINIEKARGYSKLLIQDEIKIQEAHRATLKEKLDSIEKELDAVVELEEHRRVLLKEREQGWEALGNMEKAEFAKAEAREYERIKLLKEHKTAIDEIATISKILGNLDKELNSESIAAQKKATKAAKEKAKQDKIFAEALSKRKREERLEEEKLQEDLAKIKELYRVNRLTAEQAEIEELDDLWDEYRRAGIDKEEEYQAALSAIRDKYKEKGKEAFDVFLEALDNVKTYTDVALGFFQTMFGALSQLSAAVTQERLAELDARLQAELEAAGLLEQTEMDRLQAELEAAKEAGDEETADKLKQDIERLKIEQEYEKEKIRVRYEGELAAWKFKIASAAAAIPGAVINAMKTGFGAGFPVGLVLGPALGVTAGILGGVQLAAIKKSKPKPPAFATGGIVIPAGTSGREVNVAENGSPELLLNSGNEGRAFLRQFANEIAGQMGGAQGGTLVAQLIVDGRKLAESSSNYYNNGIVRLKL